MTSLKSALSNMDKQTKEFDAKQKEASDKAIQGMMMRMERLNEDFENSLIEGQTSFAQNIQRLLDLQGQQMEAQSLAWRRELEKTGKQLDAQLEAYQVLLQRKDIRRLTSSFSASSDAVGKSVERLDNVRTSLGREVKSQVQSQFRMMYAAMALVAVLCLLTGGGSVWAFMAKPEPTDGLTDREEALWAVLMEYDRYVQGELYPNLNTKRRAEIDNLRKRIGLGK